MTQDEAHKLISEAFPGKHYYMSVHRWGNRDGKPLLEAPDFALCVYLTDKVDVRGHYETASGAGRNLAEAVEHALAKQPAKRDADAMFSDPKTEKARTPCATT